MNQSITPPNEDEKFLFITEEEARAILASFDVVDLEIGIDKYPAAQSLSKKLRTAFPRI